MLFRSALLEIEERGACGNFDVGNFHQTGSDPVPDRERYFSLDEWQSLDWKRAAVNDFGVFLFLPDGDPSQGILSPGGDVPALGLSEKPERLAQECVYEHPGWEAI